MLDDLLPVGVWRMRTCRERDLFVGSVKENIKPGEEGVDIDRKMPPLQGAVSEPSFRSSDAAFAYAVSSSMLPFSYSNHEAERRILCRVFGEMTVLVTADQVKRTSPRSKIRAVQRPALACEGEVAWDFVLGEVVRVGLTSRSCVEEAGEDGPELEASEKSSDAAVRGEEDTEVDIVAVKRCGSNCL